MRLPCIMSASFGFSFYSQNSKFVTGQVIPLGLFEVDNQGIEQDSIRDLKFIGFRGGIVCLNIIRNDNMSLYEWGIDPKGLSFYDSATSLFDEEGFFEIDGKTYIVMFAPKQILEVISALNNSIDRIKNSYSEYDIDTYNVEKIKLQELEVSLKYAVDNEIIVSCMWE